MSVKNIAYYCTSQGSIEKQNQYILQTRCIIMNNNGVVSVCGFRRLEFQKESVLQSV